MECICTTVERNQDISLSDDVEKIAAWCDRSTCSISPGLPAQAGFTAIPMQREPQPSGVIGYSRHLTRAVPTPVGQMEQLKEFV